MTNANTYDPLAVENLPDNQVWPKLDFDALTVLECIAGDSVTLLTAADALLHSGDTSIDPVTIPVNKYLVGIGLLRKGIAGIVNVELIRDYQWSTGRSVAQ